MRYSKSGCVAFITKDHSLRWTMDALHLVLYRNFTASSHEDALEDVQPLANPSYAGIAIWPDRINLEAHLW